jgi:hypothetical protein
MAKALQKFGEAALKARLVNGQWHKPKVSNRVAADLKKKTLSEGGYATASLRFRTCYLV